MSTMGARRAMDACVLYTVYAMCVVLVYNSYRVEHWRLAIGVCNALIGACVTLSAW